MSVKAFTYLALPIGLQIRLLALQPGDGAAPLESTFIVTTSDDKTHEPLPQFEALSYMWGASGDSGSISIDGRPLQISRHLEGILRGLRDKSNVRRLWIDAICINQGDVQERNSQVQLMRRIYRQAQAVLIWLDLEVDITQAAFQRLQTITQDSTPKDLNDSPDFWDPVLEVFQDQYWSRVWIQQEISNASTLRVLCRGVELSALSVYHFLRLFTELQYDDILGQSWWDWAIKKPSVVLPERFGYIDSHLHPRKGTTLGSEELDLIGAFSKSNTLRCTDDRDRVYGLMFLANDCEETDISVNYTLTLPEVYRNAAEAIMTKYKSTNLLLFSSLDYGSMQVLDTTPTWVPDWRRAPCRPAMARSLPSGMISQARNPSRGVAASFSNGILSVAAVKVDTVSRSYLDLFTKDLLSMSISEFMDICIAITRDAAALRSTLQIPEMITTDYEGLESLDEWHAVVRTLGEADNRDREKHRDLNEILYKGAGELLNLCQLNDNGGFKAGEHQLGKLLNAKAEADILRAGRVFISFAWWASIKQFPWLSETGYPGLAPKCTKLGDEVWLIAGCELPVMLRPSGNEHMVVGETYLDGANYWEPVGGVKWELKEGEIVNGYTVRKVHLI